MKYSCFRAGACGVLLLLTLALAAPPAPADNGSLPMLSAPGEANASDASAARRREPAPGRGRGRRARPLALAGDRRAAFDPRPPRPCGLLLAGPGDGLDLPAMDGASGAMSSEIMDSSLARILDTPTTPGPGLSDPSVGDPRLGLGAGSDI
jgi:hypothetical protein